MPGQFHELLQQLLAQHDEEVRLLKDQNAALQEQIISLSVAEDGPSLKGRNSHHKGSERVSRVSIASKEFLPNEEETYEVLEMEDEVESICAISEKPEIDEQLQVDHQASTRSARSRGSKESNRNIAFVRTTVYGIGQVAAPALRGRPDDEPTKCTVTVTCGDFSGETKPAMLQQEVLDLPLQISDDWPWKAEWGETGADVLLCIPASMLEEYLEVDIDSDVGTLASGRVKTNSLRQQWTLEGGGFMEAEVKVEKVNRATEKFRSRRASTTTRFRIIERLEKLFNVKDPKVKVVMGRDLSSAMQKASSTGKSTRTSTRQTTRFEITLGPEELDEVVLELKRIYEKVFNKGSKKGHMQPVLAWNDFVELMLLSDLPKLTDGPLVLNLFIVQRELLGEEMPATGTSTALLMAYEKKRKPVSTSQRWVDLVTAVSTAAIILSFIFMGVALDTNPDWVGWLVVDTIVALVFVAEVFIKSYVITPSVYFLGRDCLWNCFDVALSLVAVVEILINLIFTSAGAQAKGALVLRGLRLARMARLAKLIRMPLLAELANLISGFVLSVRSLFWVMIFLALIVYVVALGFRAAIQTATFNECDYSSHYGDHFGLDELLPSGCKLHYMYGHEFCGSVFGCMFSIFRCMISECTTKGGRSLTMIFSDGIGVEFDLFYSCSMVVVIFGLFNIITAIFVEATLNGLRENELQRRYAKAYESSYMTEQLAKLVMTVSTQVEKLRSRTAVPLLSALRNSNALADGEIYLSEEEFNQLVRHPDVRVILNDLDVSVEPRSGIFEAFNTEEDGTVSLSELVHGPFLAILERPLTLDTFLLILFRSGLMRLRGELHKVDMVIAQMSLDQILKQFTGLRQKQEASSSKRRSLKAPST
ncbi:unnamed protein product [Durusdinium trenchii]|uniref:Uncharacterized protein n=2 Tax=Durusdinium trenchii TaxID=1381693 RepID=A0ABP0HT05_9DINO